MLNKRERLTFLLVLFLIKILNPLQYSHELKEILENLTKEMDKDIA